MRRNLLDNRLDVDTTLIAAWLRGAPRPVVALFYVASLEWRFISRALSAPSIPRCVRALITWLLVGSTALVVHGGFPASAAILMARSRGQAQGGARLAALFGSRLRFYPALRGMRSFVFAGYWVDMPAAMPGTMWRVSGGACADPRMKPATCALLSPRPPSSTAPCRAPTSDASCSSALAPRHRGVRRTGPSLAKDGHLIHRHDATQVHCPTRQCPRARGR